MAHRRRHPRISGLGDLSVTLRPSESPAHFDALVLDLSERGMLIAGGGLDVGESVGIELAGPDFRLAGQGQVVHSNSRTAGLRVLSWSGPADRVICALIEARLAVAPGSRLRLLSHIAQQRKPSGARAAPRAEEPLSAASALVLERSDDDAALVASVAYSPSTGSRFG